MDDLTETGKRIRQLRLEKGWSQAQLGKEVGLSRTKWSFRPRLGARHFVTIVENA